MTNKKIDLPDDWSDDPKNEYRRFLEYRISDQELETVNRLAGRFQDSMVEAFGPRAEIVLVNLIGSQLAHMLQSDSEAFAIFTTINEWFAIAPKQHGGRPFKLTVGDPEDDITGYVAVAGGQAA